MSRQLPPLNSLRAFEAAARHLSFARAAEELHVTPAAISQQIKLLEEYLGVALFQRGKKLVLSESADAALHLVSDAFEQLERAVLKLRADRTGGTLVVSAPPAFASRWLIPRLEDFHARHPDIELRLLATKRQVDFRVEDVDVAIRFGAGNYAGLLGERLMPETIIPVAVPALAAGVNTPADLLQCNLLEDEWHTGNGVFPDWATWLATLGVQGAHAPRVRHFGDANLAIQAALSGLGATLTWHSLVVDDLKAGRLMRLLNQAIPTEMAYHLVMPGNRAPLARVAAFRTWLLEQAAMSQAPAWESEQAAPR